MQSLMLRVPLLALCTLALSAGSAAAHTTLTYPAPRTLANKAGPCGATGSTRGTDIAVFEPGATITVEWDETVDHIGHYRVAFDMDGDDDFPTPMTPGDDFPTVLADQIVDRDGGGLYSQEVTLPDAECENCTLQLIQIMTTNVPYDSFYFQCADVALRVGDGPPGGAGSDAGEQGGRVSGGCNAGGSPSAGWATALVLLGLAAYRRRASI